jgi:hypothetical protein
MHHRLFGLEMTNDLPTEERKELIDNLIDNHEIKLYLYQTMIEMIIANLSLIDLCQIWNNNNKSKA